MISNPNGVQECVDQLAELWAPISHESVCDWVEKNVELPSGEITGKIQLRYIPYGREILERMADRRTRHLVMVFSTQSAKTTLLVAGMLHSIAKNAQDAMWIMGNSNQARDFNKERFMPFATLCQPVADLIPRTDRGLIDKHYWGFMNQHYKSMVLNFVGAGSPANLASRPRGRIWMDEVDKFSEEIGFNAGTIQLAEERQKTFSFPISVKASSPTLVDRMIWAEYLKTDMRQFWVPCPRCGENILFRFRIKSEKHGDCGICWWHDNEDEAQTDGEWDFKKVRAMAYYKCQNCGGMIHDFERRDILQNGIWIPSNLKAPEGRYGYHINSIYSTLGGETSLGSIAVKFLMAQGLRSELKTFFNDWMAEPWDESLAYNFKEVKLEVFTGAEIPADGCTSLMAIDYQQHGYWVLVRKFQAPTPEFPHGQSWLLYAGFVDSETELDEIQAEYGVIGENVTIDMAHKPNAAARLIIEHKWRGIWGSPTAKHYAHPTGDGRMKIFKPYSEVKTRDPMLGTKWQNRTLDRARFIYFAKDPMLDIVESLRHSEPFIWHCTVNVSPEYNKHLNSRVKRMQKNKKTGRPEWVWYELNQQNHLYDCEVHVTVRALMLGLISLPDETDAQNVDK